MIFYSKKKKTHVDDYVNRKDYFDKYFGRDTILTIFFFFQMIILDLNSIFYPQQKVTNKHNKKTLIDHKTMTSKNFEQQTYHHFYMETSKLKPFLLLFSFKKTFFKRKFSQSARII